MLDQVTLLLLSGALNRRSRTRWVLSLEEIAEDPIFDVAVLVRNHDVRPDPLDPLEIKEREGGMVCRRNDDGVLLEGVHDVPAPVLGEVVPALVVLLEAKGRGNNQQTTGGWQNVSLQLWSKG